ncbi:MAG: restriction endonuclease subunit S [Bacteroidales bacterium]|nr:restriction endonuclease subunit S [Bacteroidales bacterium]
MSEWKEKFLKEVVDIRVSNVDKKIYPNKTLVKLCNYMDCYSNDYISYEIPFKIGSADAIEIQKFSLKINDVIITKDSETPDDIAISSVVIEELENVVCGYHLAILRPNKNELDGRFLMLKLKDADSKNYFLSVANGSTRYGLTIGNIEKAKIKYPSLLIQRQIARILSTADTVIEKTQATIAKYKAIKQGMLHDLFTRGIDISTGKLRPRYEDAPELYKESKLGMIPKDWEVKPLEDITEYVDYRGKTPPKSEFGIYLVTARNIKNGIIDYEISKEYIREDSYESAMSRGKVKLGDVLITTEAPMGNVAQIDKENIALAQRVIKYRGFESKLNNNFLSKFLMSENFQRQLAAEATGSTVLGIKGSRLHKLKIVVPEIEEQVLIAERIKTADNKIENEQNYLLKLQKIKTGLMSDLLSGSKSVPIDTTADKDSDATPNNVIN